MTIGVSADSDGRLDALERIIAAGLATFVEVGAALTEIRTERLYIHRDGFTSFEQYCRERWGMSKTHANRVIEGAAVASLVAPNGAAGRPMRTLRAAPPIPNEAVARELAPLRSEPDKLRAAWAQVTRDGAKVTAAVVREAVRRVSNDDSEFIQSPGSRSW